MAKLTVLLFRRHWTPDALLTRTHLRELGLERRAVDAVFQGVTACPVAWLLAAIVRASGYLHLINRSTTTVTR